MRRLAVVLVLALTGCGSVLPVPIPSADTVSVDEIPQLACPATTSTVIDYAPDAAGVQDIASATRALEGVQASDVVLRHGDSTAIVRQGRPVWTAGWVKGDRGYVLTYVTACSGVGIEGS